jgi:hypothetical protein
LTATRLGLDLLVSSLVYSFVVILIDIVVLFMVYQELSQVISNLMLVMLAEGGLGLVAGGFIGLNSPIIRRIEEDFLHVKPRKHKDKGEHEKQTKTLIITGIFLIIAALLLSAI